MITGVAMAVGNGRNRKQQQKQFDQTRKDQQALLGRTTPAGDAYLKQSQEAIQPSIDYYSSLLRGNRGDIQNTLAPELNRIASQYRGAYQTAREQMGRGGMSAAQASNLPFQQAGAENNLIFGARPQAAQALAAMGPSLGSLGLNAYGLSSNIQNNVANQGMMARQYQDQQNAALGQGLWNTYQSYLNSNATNGTINMGALPQGQNISSFYGSSPGVAQPLPAGQGLGGIAGSAPGVVGNSTSKNTSMYSRSPGTTTSNPYSGAYGASY
jgi:hypothetical protein